MTNKSRTTDPAHLLRHHLRVIVRSVWFFPLLLVLALLLLTAFRLSGSSVGVYHTMLYGKADDKSLVLNSPRAIRSDEWEVNTPFTVSQTKTDFGRINKTVGNGQDMSVTLDVPYKEWSTLFKPQNWSFFVLPVEYAFAFKWWLLGVLLMLGCYAFTLTILPKRYLLASLISLGLFFSPFVQWWYESVTLLSLAYGFFIAALCFKLMQRKLTTRQLAVYSSLLAYSLAAFGLILYAPFLIAVALVVAALVVGRAIQFYKESPRQLFLRRLGAVCAALVLALAVCLVFLKTRSGPVKALADSVYPGHRVETSGHFNVRQLLSGYFDGQLQSDTRAAHYNLNQSEASGFILVFPFLLPVMIYRLIQQKRQGKPMDWSLLFILIALLAFLVRLFVPASEFIFSLLQLNRIPHDRLIIGFGVFNTILLVLGIKYISELKRIPVWLRRGSLAFTFLLVVMVGWSLHASYPGYLGSKFKIILVALWFTIAVGLLLRRRFTLALGMLLLFSLVSTAKVNPLYQGLGVLTHSQLSTSISSLSKSDQQGEWVLGDYAASFENIPAASGARSVSGVYAYPQLSLWKPLGTAPAQKDVYNRYAHVFFSIQPTPDSPAGAYLDPPALDAFRVHADACGAFLRQTHVTFIMTTTPPPSLQCLTKVKQITYPTTTFTIYRLGH